MSPGDLRLPCRHGLYVRHAPILDDSSSLEGYERVSTGGGDHWYSCPGGRTPSNDELTDELARRGLGEWQSAVRVATGREAGMSDEITYRCTVHERIARQLDDGRLICDQGEIEKHTQKVREHCRFGEVGAEE